MKTVNVVIKYLKESRLFTDRVRSTREDYVLTRVCPSIHPSVCLSKPMGGTHLRYPSPSDLARGYPNRGTPASGTPPQVPPIRPDWGYPDGGYPTLGTAHWTWLGGTLTGGTPGGVPHLGSPHQTWLGGTPMGGYPTSGTPLVGPGQGVPCWGYLCQGVCSQSDLAGGYPNRGVPHLKYSHQTWPGGTWVTPHPRWTWPEGTPTRMGVPHLG